MARQNSNGGFFANKSRKIKSKSLKRRLTRSKKSRKSIKNKKFFGLF
jgi:hypothetical protein